MIPRESGHALQIKRLMGLDEVESTKLLDPRMRGRSFACGGITGSTAMKNKRGGWFFGIGPSSTGAILIVLLFAGCGYHLEGSGERIDPTLRTVFVDTFTNRTSEAHTENIIRTAFINRIVQEGRFKLARSRGEADIICRGAIRSLQAAPLSYKVTNLAAEDRLTITLEVFFEERESGRIIWSDRAFIGTGDYPISTVGVTEASRKNALIKLANDTAERAYRLMMSGF
jgi:hypothetical protein